MVLTNAERQAQFRQRLKARASGAALPEMAAAAAEAAVMALWSFYARPPGDGLQSGDLMDDDGRHLSLDEWRLQLAASDGLLGYCRATLDDPDLRPNERDALRLLVETRDALDLAAVRPAKGKRGKRQSG